MTFALKCLMPLMFTFIYEMILQASYKHTSGGRRLKLVCLNVSRDDTTEKAALW